MPWYMMRILVIKDIIWQLAKFSIINRDAFCIWNFGFKDSKLLKENIVDGMLAKDKIIAPKQASL